MREIVTGIVLLVLFSVLRFLVYTEGDKRGKEEMERDIVYAMASKTFTKVGRFTLCPTKDGAIMVEFNSKPFQIAGIGDNSVQKKGEKK